MLVLTRKIDQAVVLDGGIEVRVLGIIRGRVKLGFAAPRSTLILREELTDPVRERVAEGVAV